MMSWLPDIVWTAIPLVLIIIGTVAWVMAPPIGRYGGLVLIGLAAGMMGYRTGTEGARSECQAAEIQRKLDIANEDLKTLRNAAAAAEKTGQTLAAELSEKQDLLDVREKEIASLRAADDAAEQVPVAPVDGKCPAPPKRIDRSLFPADGYKRLRQFGPD
jgi:hypothetical protein